MAAMSAVMIALVVFIHLPLTDQPWGVWWRRWGVDGVCRLAVPWFYLASGAVFARHIGESEGWYGREVRKRVGSLLVPCFILNLLWLPVMMTCNWIGAEYFGQELVVKANWAWVIRGLGLSPFAWPIDVPTWFLRSLFVVVVLMGLIVVGLRIKATDRGKKIGVAAVLWAAYLIQCCTSTSPQANAFFEFAVSLQGLALFATGILLSPLLLSKEPCPGDAAFRSFTWSVLVLHAPILSVLTMPFKALGWFNRAFSTPSRYLLLWLAVLVLSAVLGHLLHISRLRRLFPDRVKSN